MMSRIAAVIVLIIFSPPTLASGDSIRGAYVFRLSGCGSCHTDPKHTAAPLAGGLKLPSPFGNFFVPRYRPRQNRVASPIRLDTGSG